MAKKNLTTSDKDATTTASTTSTLIEIFKKEADKVIVGRVEPHIYAFNTDCVPNALKVGDTYRPVLVRLKEWEKYYSNLSKVHEASAFADPNENSNDFTYFRDYAVHIFLENNGKDRLQDNEFPKNVKYHSNEFFKNATKEDVVNAIKDIQDDYRNKTRKYPFYEEGLPKKEDIKREEKYEPRDIQQTAINNFKDAWRNKRNNLLMYAVMRFGKTFTAMCCAEEMGAKIVVIVSAKKDVQNSWYEIVKGHVKFDGYEFFDAKDLIGNPNAITEYLIKNPKKNKAAVFLTLQDLSGKGPEGKAFKEKHKALFDGSITIDLLIVDETHFGARAEQYGEVLKDPKYIKDTKKGDKLDEDDFVETSEGDEVVKAFDANVKLHLSGTPYRILMGSEFEKEDIVAYFQYSDIVAEKKKWDKNNMDKDEWKNPYYGFPQMVRFAFNPNKSARKKLEEFRQNGYTYALSALLKPKSVNKDDNDNYREFENEKEVLDLLKVIDGKKTDDQLFGFLNYEKLRDEGKMCRHIVMVLPYKASCDAMQKLINDNISEFLNLKDYNIINISGVNINSRKDVPKYSTIKDDVKYSIDKDFVKTVRNIITACEQKGQKTLTLTVNRMLTGCTVPEWDTMLYMKDTSSPQEYDQAIFRLQNPYTKTYCVKDANGNPELDKEDKPIIIKKDMKPQTLLVDFDPIRLFLLQEHRAQIYNVNNQNIGNSNLKVRIAKELSISPLLTIDPDGNIVKVKASNILDKVSQYHYDKGIREEVDEIPIDMGLYDDNEDFRNAIAKENEIGSKSGLSIPAHEGDETDPTINATGNNTIGTKNGDVSGSPKKQDPQKIWEKKLKSYFVKILLYAYLTDEEVKSLQEISDGLDSNDNNRRIAMHLGLKKSMLQILLSNIKRLGHYEMISRLDYKIQDINKLSHNTKLSVEKQVEVALCKFGKLGDAMVITPANIANDMVALFPEAVLKTKNVHLLDIAATSGEFAIALYRRMKELKIEEKIIKESIYSIPKSSICYELTRKVYKLLGLEIENIAENFNAFDLLNVKKGKKIDYNKIKKLLGQNKIFNKISLEDQPNEKDNNMIEFDAIVSNPPYQVMDGGAQASAKPVYNEFVSVAKIINPKYISMIMPARWYAGGKGLSIFRDQMLKDTHISVFHDFMNPEQLFQKTNIRGGLCYFLWDSNYDNSQNLTRVITHSANGIISDVKRTLKTEGTEIFIRNAQSISIIDKVFNNNPERFDKYVSSRKPFGLDTTFSKSSKFKKSPNEMIDAVKCYGKGWKVGYVERTDIKKNNKWIDTWKVFAPYANNIGTELNDDNLISVIGEPKEICTESYLVLGINLSIDKVGATNLSKYTKTKFLRFLHSLAKASQHATSKTYHFVPLQDFTNNSDIPWAKSVSDIDKYLYEKYKLSDDEIAFIEKTIKPML